MNLPLHSSSNLIVYTTTSKGAAVRRAPENNWFSTSCSKLTLQHLIDPVVTRGTPTIFNPQTPDHMEMLVDMNCDAIESALLPLLSRFDRPRPVPRSHTHPSICISCALAEQQSKQSITCPFTADTLVIQSQLISHYYSQQRLIRYTVFRLIVHNEIFCEIVM